MGWFTQSYSDFETEEEREAYILQRKEEIRRISDGEGVSYREDKVLRKYKHAGKTLGELISVRCSDGSQFSKFRPNISKLEAVDLVQDMPPEDKIHLRHNAYAIYKLLEHFEIDHDVYVTDEDIAIHVANKGFSTLTELYRGDKRAWKLVKERALESELFDSFISFRYFQPRKKHK